MAYAIITKENPASFFTGFDGQGNPEFGPRDRARLWDDLDRAECQALLLVRFGAQRSPVVVHNFAPRPWQARPDLMDRLTKAQNLPENSGVDIMTFASFMDTEAALDAYVQQEEKT